MTDRSPTRWTIYRRLLLLGTLPALAMFLLMLTFFTQARLGDMRDHLFNSSQLIANNLAPAAEYSVITGHQGLLTGLLEQTLESSRLVWIKVRDISGNTVASAGSTEGHDPNRLHQFRRDIIQLPLSIEPDDDLSWIEGNLRHGRQSTIVGEVVVAVSDDVLAQEQRAILWTSGAIGLILFSATLIFVGRLAYRLSVPIENLINSVETLTEGNYDIYPQATGVARELQTLQGAITQLAARLKKQDQERQKSLEQIDTARRAAESASTAKSEFLAIMSHELRTPLNGVLGMLQLLEDEQLNDTQKDYLKTAHNSTEDLLTIITDILDFSRIEQGRLVIEHNLFSVRALVENCFSSFRHEAEEKGLDYQLRFRGDWPEHAEAYGDAGRLRQVLGHLIANAIKFTDEGRVIITTYWSGHCDPDSTTLTCEIEDTGTGIPSHRMGDMFNSFEQMDASSSRQFGGTGLGLPLVQRLVELMGGHVAVDSALACGSTFRFVVPLEVAKHQQEDLPEPRRRAVASLPPGKEKKGRAYHALVVEDNPVNQRVALRLLDKLGFLVDCAENGAQALNLFREAHHGYDVILMDCQMPVMDGWEATRQIRQREQLQGANSAVPIIAMTADVLPGTEASCLQAGMNDYLPKPVRRGSLREALQRHLSI